jgi:hypothetical protein
MSVPTAPIVATGIIGGYLVARVTKIRPLGGAVLGIAGAAAGREWATSAGPQSAAVLSTIYTSAFALSHPLAKKIGPWPSVLVAAGTSAAAAWLIADRKRPQEA